MVQVFQRYGYSYQLSLNKNEQRNDTTFSKKIQTIKKPTQLL